MALTVKTNNPEELLELIKNKIDESFIDTWLYDTDGDFTHVPSQWLYKAWMHPFPEGKQLIFGIIGQKGIKMQKDIYAVYHGRFAEMLLSHFDEKIQSMEISSMGIGRYDHFESSSTNI